MYSVARNEDKCEVQLMRYNKSFSKKAVQQIEVVPEYNILISLTGQSYIIKINKIYFTLYRSIICIIWYLTVFFVEPF